MEDMLKQRLQKNIRSLRESRDWSQTVLAKKMGVTPQYVSKLETGETAPGLEVIERLSKTFGLSDPADILSEEILQLIS